jgi:hypothetical protein
LKEVPHSVPERSLKDFTSRAFSNDEPEHERISEKVVESERSMKLREVKRMAKNILSKVDM